MRFRNKNFRKSKMIRKDLIIIALFRNVLNFS